MKPMAVEIGAQVYLVEGGEEIGAVRQVAHDHILVYVEGTGDFIVSGQGVKAAHDGKVILDPAHLDAALLEAAGHAHERETE